MISTINPKAATSQGVNQGSSLKRGNPSQSKVFMCHWEINLQIRNRNYESTASRSKGNEGYEFEKTQPLHIEKAMNNTMPRMSKDVLKKYTYNPNSCATQNYSIMEYIA